MAELELEEDVRYDIGKVVDQAISPEKHFCMGYLNVSSNQRNGYISTFKMSADTVELGDMDVRSQINIAKARCTRNDAYMGQVNVSGFNQYCGLHGAIWGYDIARNEELDQQKPLFYQSQYQPQDAPVFDIKPILNATERLFGQADQQRFPIAPGAQVPGSNSIAESRGPIWTWAIMGIAIPSNRQENACILIQDIGTYGNDRTNESEIIGYLDGMIRKISYSISILGKDQQMMFDRIYAGYKYIFVEPGELGCTMACVPNIYLAQDAIPKGMKPDDLQQLTLSQWEKALNLPALPNPEDTDN